MLQNGVRKFRITHAKSSDQWHFGLCFCVEGQSNFTGKRDIYLFMCLGTHDFCIGMVTDYDEIQEAKRDS